MGLACDHLKERLAITSFALSDKLPVRYRTGKLLLSVNACYSLDGCEESSY